MTCTGEAITLFNHNIYCCTLQDIDAKLDFRVSKEDKLSVWDTDNKHRAGRGQNNLLFIHQVALLAQFRFDGW